MADSTVPLNNGSGGKTLDTESLTGAGAVTVERQRLEVAGAALAEIARVLNTTPTGTEYGLATRAVGPLPAGTNTIGAVTRTPITDTTASGTIAAAAATVALALAGQSAIAIQITGVWVGTLQFEGTVDGTTWAPINSVVAGTSTPTPTTSTGGLFRLTPGGLAQVRVNATAWTSGTATVTIRASVAGGGTFLNQSLTAGTNTIGSVALVANSVAVGGRADGFVNTRQDPSSLLFDTFETFNTTDTWTAGGTVPPTASAGNLAVAPGTAANATSFARSQAAFIPGSSSYLQVGMVLQIDAGVVTGNTRWWGLGIPNGVPTTSIPITNGVVFELRAVDGALYGSVYSGSAVTQSIALTRPTDGGVHRYQITYKSSKVYFNIDNVDVGSIPFPNTAVSSLPLTTGSVNGGSTLGAPPTLNVSVFGLGDTAHNNFVLSDGIAQWRKATIKPASTAPVAADTALVVAVSPNSPAQTIRTTDVNGTSISAFPAGFMRVSDEPTQLFYDPFDSTLDTTSRWITPVSGNGATAASVSLGVLTLATGTTANGYSYLTSQPSFTPTVPAWLGTSFAMKVPNPVVTNQYFFWGLGTSPGVPTTTAPLTDAYGFELYTDGKMYCVMYAAGVRMVVQDLSAATGNNKQPTDGAYHRYIIYYRTDKTFFYIDGIDSTTQVAVSNFTTPNVQTLPIRFQAGGAATPPGSSGALTCTGLATWDTGKNNFALSDGVLPWRKATIKPASITPVATDTALVVAIAPNNANPDATSTGALGALNAAVQVSTSGLNTAGFQLAAGTLIGTIVPECSFDGGTTWAASYFDTAANGKVSSIVFGSANTATGATIVGVGGSGLSRVRVSAYTSGTANIIVRASTRSDPSLLYGGSPGAAVPPSTAFVGGTDGSLLRAFLTDTLGRQVIVTPARTRVSIIFQAVATATADTLLSLVKSSNGTAAAGATTIPVTASKTLRITAMTFSLKSNAAAAAFATFTIRVNPSGAALISSQSEMRIDLGNTAATIGAADKMTIAIPDGFELSGAAQLAVSAQAQAITNILSVALTGYEY